ncbi:U4/U6 small nuclear ribonucleoprotein Prp31-like protein, partial [Thalictrum thalictroides]
YAVTDMRKLANRMQFGVPEESSLGDGLGEGYGMLGQAGSGKLFKEKRFGPGGATSGLTSSLAFTPVQTIRHLRTLPTLQAVRPLQTLRPFRHLRTSV